MKAASTGDMILSSPINAKASEYSLSQYKFRILTDMIAQETTPSHNIIINAEYQFENISTSSRRLTAPKTDLSIITNVR